MLIAVARRLRTVVRDRDTVARLGGDDFLVLVEDLDGSEHPEALAERVIRAVSKPIPRPGGVAHVGASIGYAVIDEPIEAAEAFVAVADPGDVRRQTGRAVAAHSPRRPRCRNASPGSSV